MDTEPRQISEQVRRELWQLQLRLKGQGKRMAWEQLFRESDRKRVTQQELENRHIADIWADLHGISVWRAVLDLALKLNLLWPQRWSRRRLAESRPLGNQSFLKNLFHIFNRNKGDGFFDDRRHFIQIFFVELRNKNLGDAYTMGGQRFLFETPDR